MPSQAIQDSRAGHWCLVYRLRPVKLLRWDNGFEVTQLIHNLNQNSCLFKVKKRQQTELNSCFQIGFLNISPICLLLAGQTDSPAYKLMQLFEFMLKWSMFHYRLIVIHFSMESTSGRFTWLCILNLDKINISKLFSLSNCYKSQHKTENVKTQLKLNAHELFLNELLICQMSRPELPRL